MGNHGEICKKDGRRRLVQTEAAVEYKQLAKFNDENDLEEHQGKIMDPLGKEFEDHRWAEAKTQEQLIESIHWSQTKLSKENKSDSWKR